MDAKAIMEARERLARAREKAATGERGPMDADTAAVAARLALVNQAHALEDTGDYLGAGDIYDWLSRRPDLQAFPASVAGFRNAAYRARLRVEGHP